MEKKTMEKKTLEFCITLAQIRTPCYSGKVTTVFPSITSLNGFVDKQRSLLGVELPLPQKAALKTSEKKISTK
jgi:hypothetical protein